MMETARCPACDGARRRLVETVTGSRLAAVWDRHYPGRGERWPAALRGDVRVWGCEDCELEWAEPAVAADSEWYRAVDAYPSARWEYGIVLELVDPADAVIELGCGPGHFLQRAQAAGIDAVGFDGNLEAVAAASGLRAHHGEIGEALAPERPGGAVVVAFHLIEHVTDLAALGAGLARRAREVHLSFPNPARWTRYLLDGWRAGQHEMWNYPPWHQTRWNRRSIAAFGRRFGFELERYIEEPLRHDEVVAALVAEGDGDEQVCRAWLAARLARLRDERVAIGGRSCLARLVASSGRERRREER